MSTLPTHCDPSTILTVPATWSLAPGEAVPIPTFPALRTRIFSVLFVLTTRSIASVVPIKLVPATVLAFPVINHHVPAHPAGVVHVARPVASEVSTLLAPGVPPVILICHATSRRAPGVAVPIPIAPVLVIRTTSVGATLVVPFRLANTISPCVFPAILVVRNPISAGAYLTAPARELYPNPIVWSEVTRVSSHPILRYGVPYATASAASAHWTHRLIWS